MVKHLMVRWSGHRRRGTHTSGEERERKRRGKRGKRGRERKRREREEIKKGGRRETETRLRT